MTSMISMLLHGVPPQLPEGVTRTIRSWDDQPTPKAPKTLRPANIDEDKEAVFNAIKSGIETRSEMEEATGLSRKTIDDALFMLISGRRVTFKQVNTAKYYAVTGRKPKCRSERSKQRLSQFLALIQSRENTTMTMLACETGLTEGSIRTWLQTLEKDGLIYRKKDGRGAYWSMTKGGAA